MSNQSITIKSIQDRMAQGVPLGQGDEATVRRLWWAALDTLQSEILLPMNLTRGLWLSSPLPALYEPKLLQKLKGWVWSPKELIDFQMPEIGLLPPSCSIALNPKKNPDNSNYNFLTLNSDDGNDPLLLVITPEIQIALALQGNKGQRNLLMRSDPDTLRDLLTMLDIRLNSENYDQALLLRNELEDLGQLKSNAHLAQSFWPLLANRLATIAPSINIQTLPSKNIEDNPEDGEISLLEALTHEVRTPLATIRTLIRSLLRRNDISNIVENRLKQIDAECTEQIDRFGLIFNAVELERSKSEESKLAETDLGYILQILSPNWSQQLDRKGLKLVLDISPELPKILSDPEGLELMLGGLVDSNTRGLPPGAVLRMKLRPAGQRIKLQIISEVANIKTSRTEVSSSNSSIGPVLSWNPITGSLQLSQAATQRLLKSLGGRLTNRRESGLTIFFPISDAKKSY